jgi:hypothetical protein
MAYTPGHPSHGVIEPTWLRTAPRWHLVLQQVAGGAEILRNVLALTDASTKLL